MLKSEIRLVKIVLTPCLILLISIVAAAQQNVLEAPEDAQWGWIPLHHVISLC
jgi:hypothetical protein